MSACKSDASGMFFPQYHPQRLFEFHSSYLLICSDVIPLGVFTIASLILFNVMDCLTPVSTPISRAAYPALWQISTISAPEYPSVISASSLMSILGSTSTGRSCSCKISALASKSGRPTYSNVVSLPGRIKAGSNLFVNSGQHSPLW